MVAVQLGHVVIEEHYMETAIEREEAAYGVNFIPRAVVFHDPFVTVLKWIEDIVEMDDHTRV
ncbi:hypothetical protein D3C71_2231770 [compost metagenome]